MQLRHLTCRLSACQPRASSPMPRSALTRSCSTIVPAAPSFAGDSVPQNGQTSFCFAGFHVASPPQAGHANFDSATVADISPGCVIESRIRSRARRCRGRARASRRRRWSGWFAYEVRNRTSAYEPPSGKPGNDEAKRVAMTARCTVAPRGPRWRRRASAQFSAVIACWNRAPAAFQVAAPSSASASASQSRATFWTIAARGSCANAARGTMTMPASTTSAARRVKSTRLMRSPHRAVHDA